MKDDAETQLNPYPKYASAAMIRGYHLLRVVTIPIAFSHALDPNP